MNTYLQELVAAFEKTLARSGFGVLTHASVQDAEREGTILVFTSSDGGRWAYRFEYRDSVDDEAKWIADLAGQLTSDNLTAIYAVSRHVFSEHGERVARTSYVGVHEVAAGIPNRAIVVSQPAEPKAGSRSLPPLILTQRLKSGPESPRWFGCATLSDDRGPVMDIVFEGVRNPDGTVTVRKEEIPLRSPGTDIHMRMRPAEPSQPGLTTCYARHLGGCDGQSGEHVISESVLKLFPGDSVVVEVTPGLPADRSYKTGIRALKWPVLCKKHNGALSDVDKDGAAFFALVNDALNGRTPAAGTRTSFVGTRIERWLLKVACGVIASEARRGVMSDVPLEWIQVLFGEKPWPAYFCSFWADREGSRSHEYGFEVITTIDSVTARPKGVTFKAFRMSVVLALGSFNGVPGLRRPGGVRLGLNDLSVDVELIWPDDGGPLVNAAHKGVAADGASRRR